MQNSVENLLKKINYIEAEIEIQKQILVSIPSDQKNDIEAVILKIKQAKEEIESLRSEIEKVSPEEYEKLLTIERSVEAFKAISAEKKFTTVESATTNPDCAIQYRSGKLVPCLVKACDEQGNWTVITSEGEILHLDGVDIVTTENN